MRVESFFNTAIPQFKQVEEIKDDDEEEEEKPKSMYLDKAVMTGVKQRGIQQSGRLVKFTGSNGVSDFDCVEDEYLSQI